MSANTQIVLRSDEDEPMDKFPNNDLVDAQVITDNQEYYEIMLVDPQNDGSTETKKIPIKIVPSSSSSIRPNLTIKPLQSTTKIMPLITKAANPITMTRVIKSEPVTKIIKSGRKKKPPAIKPLSEPVKILPKVPGNLFKYVDEPRQSNLDQLVEKILKEYNNEIDVFFRSMAASVKKLQPNLIPKVKMEVCNVIAKYEMQSFVNQYPDA